jgi:hypothetical protein
MSAFERLPGCTEGPACRCGDIDLDARSEKSQPSVGLVRSTCFTLGDWFGVHVNTVNPEPAIGFVLPDRNLYATSGSLTY